jgi:hypothetical protein
MGTRRVRLRRCADRLRGHLDRVGACEATEAGEHLDAVAAQLVTHGLHLKVLHLADLDSQNELCN